MCFHKIFLFQSSVFFLLNTQLLLAQTVAPKPEKPIKTYISQPLVSHIYTADPSARVFNGRIYIYPSHDTASNAPNDGAGGHYDMMDYRVLSMDGIGGKVTDHGIALDLAGIPWASKQLWAPNAAFANKKYYLFFPAKNKEGIFQMGVATAIKPEGPFKAAKEPIKGSYSIDPCVFKDDDGNHYMYFGGIQGGQLQNWNNNQYTASAINKKPDEPAILPRVAKMKKNMLEFDEPVKEIELVDSNGKLLTEKMGDKRFFEGAWVFKKDGLYYFTYSTGTSHNICYATGNNPYGPFTYRGIILLPVQGWTTHVSTIQHQGKWFLFYHDTELSGQNHLRNVKVTEMKFNADGSIQTINPFK